MTRFRMGVFLLAVYLLGRTTSIDAHHSFGAEYDADKPITLKGVITRVEWANPHCHMYIDVKEPNGTTKNWQLEGYPPNVLARTGFKKDVTLKTQAVLSPDRPRGMVPGMATRKITITLQDNQIQEIQSLVERGQARNVSSFVQHAVSIALHDAAGWQEMLESALIESGGPLTKEERAWADRLLSAKSSKRRSRRGKVA